METGKVTTNPPPPQNVHPAFLSRMNQAPVQGFEADVGEKTTVHVTYPKMDSPQDPGAQLLLLPLNSSGLQWVTDIVQKDSIIQKAENPGYGGGGQDIVRGIMGTLERPLLAIRAPARLT